jgi:hypothetical protein
MHGAIVPFRIRAASAMCITAGISSFAVCAFYLGVLFIIGVPDKPLDYLAFLCRILVFPFFLISLASLRWASVSLWVNSILVWVIGIVMSWPTPDVSPFSGRGSWLQIFAACLVTGAYLFLSKARVNSDAFSKNPTLVTLLRGNL